MKAQYPFHFEYLRSNFVDHLDSCAINWRTISGKYKYNDGFIYSLVPFNTIYLLPFLLKQLGAVWEFAIGGGGGGWKPTRRTCCGGPPFSLLAFSGFSMDECWESIRITADDDPLRILAFAKPEVGAAASPASSTLIRG
jgi:hypothetical protein